MIHPKWTLSCFHFKVNCPSDPKGVPQISSDGWSNDFFGFEIFNSGIFLGRTIWRLFLGWLNLSKDILGIESNLRICGSTFLELSFDSGIFGGFVGSPRDFLDLIFAPIHHPLHLKSWISPPPPPRVSNSDYLCENPNQVDNPSQKIILKTLL